MPVEASQPFKNYLKFIPFSNHVKPLTKVQVSACFFLAQYWSASCQNYRLNQGLDSWGSLLRLGLRIGFASLGEITCDFVPQDSRCNFLYRACR